MKNQYGAYTQNQREDESVRETEAHALLNCASRLEAARQEGISAEEFVGAVRHNQQLWTLFQACLTEKENALPRDLKILLLNLSRYVDKTSFRAIAEHNPSLLTSLVSINREIAAGLSVKQGADRKTMPSDPATASGSVMTSV